MKIKPRAKSRILLWATILGLLMICALFFASQQLLWASISTWICLPIILIVALTASGKKHFPGSVNLKAWQWLLSIVALQLAYFAWLAVIAEVMAPKLSDFSPWLLVVAGNTFVYGWHPWGWVALLLVICLRAAPHARPSLGQQLGSKYIPLNEMVNFAAHAGLTIVVATTFLCLVLIAYHQLQQLIALPALQPLTTYSFGLMLGLVLLSCTHLWQGIIARLPQTRPQHIWLWHWGSLFVLLLLAGGVAIFSLDATKPVDFGFSINLNAGQAWGLLAWALGILVGPSCALLIAHYSQGRSLRSTLLALFMLPIAIALLFYKPVLITGLINLCAAVNAKLWTALAAAVLIAALMYLMRSPLNFVWLAQCPNYCSGKITRLSRLFARNCGFHAYCLAFFLILGTSAITLLGVLFAFPLFFAVLLMFFLAKGPATI